ncbi:MAG: Glu-tRNA(Gln) amidotransferase subunit GatD [Candidatus Thermoplasmatota archaeon]|jgi:glutamyl-tRNA(Gln) amidotransferase subunit D|nr:Glu-tRNA(Gln) amidotransferase subunit GatD [Candidatus Thermoplasmatota archaeon]MCL5984079.1 Glu-tRNA(Gln) amidotransferase subunit GatD [Candidatus Thermoplasmatota archaeon]
MSGGEKEADVTGRVASLPPGTHLAVVLEDGRRWEGWLIPRDPYSAADSLRLKLPSGYNIGLSLHETQSIEELGGPLWGEEARTVRREETTEESNGGAVSGGVAILTTGGTIASYVDYVTGGVKPVRGRRALEALFPEVDGPIVLKEVFDILSEDIGPGHWHRLGTEVKTLFDQGAKGVVIAHGTDTMAYTAGALAFQLRDLPGPVVMVGAQRSIDRPSSDGVFNMRCAVQVAREADLGEVVVLMHGNPSDRTATFHRGTRVRKMHSTRRDAFRTLNQEPLGTVDTTITLNPDHRPRSPGKVRLEEGFDRRGRLLWIHPGLTPEAATAFTAGARGIVLAGTGMGHLASELVPWVQRTTESGVIVAMTTQCLGGTVDPYVYSRGRELLSAGVVYLGDMLPETAYVKLLWALHQSQSAGLVTKILTTDLAGEMGERRPLIGGMPE